VPELSVCKEIDGKLRDLLGLLLEKEPAERVSVEEAL